MGRWDDLKRKWKDAKDRMSSEYYNLRFKASEAGEKVESKLPRKKEEGGEAEGKAKEKKEWDPVKNLLILLIEVIIFILLAQYTNVIPIISGFVSPLIEPIVEQLQQLGPIGAAIVSMGFTAFIVIILLSGFIPMLMGKGLRGTVKYLQYVFLSLDLIFLVPTVGLWTLSAVPGGKEQADCISDALGEKGNIYDCFATGLVKAPQKQGCRDCLDVKFVNAPTVAANNKTYRFLVELKNKDCPVQEDPQRCTGKTLKDVSAWGGAYYGKAMIAGDSRDIGNLGPGDSTQYVLDIPGISSDVFDRYKFRLNVSTEYGMDTTATSEILLFNRIMDMTKETPAKAVTQAGPVDLALNFAPNKIAIEQGTPVNLQIGFILQVNGLAKIKNLKLTQFASSANALRIDSCVGMTYTTSTEENTVQYDFDMSNFFGLQRQGGTGSYQNAIFCEFSLPSSIEGSKMRIVFSAEAEIDFTKSEQFDKTVSIM